MAAVLRGCCHIVFVLVLYCLSVQVDALFAMPRCHLGVENVENTPLLITSGGQTPPLQLLNSDVLCYFVNPTAWA